MANFRKNSWFFEITKTLLKRGTRLRSEDRPSQSTFEDLLHSIVNRNEESNRAQEDNGTFDPTKNGHVTLASNTQAKSNEVQKTNRSLVSQPHQLPTIKSINQTTDGSEFGFPINAFTIAPNTNISTRNEYDIKLNEEWYSKLLTALPSQTDVTGKVALYVNGTEGNDVDGDGSINKPFKTLAKAKEMVQKGQTIIVYAATYTNSVNMVKGGINETDLFVYSILFFPGVIINQDTESFLDNGTLHGLVNIYGKPTVNINSSTIPALKISPKRTGTAPFGGSEVISYYEFKEVLNNGAFKAVEFVGSYVATINFSASRVVSLGSKIITMEGTGIILTIKIPIGITPLATSGTIDLIDVISARSITIYESKFSASGSSSANINAINVSAVPTSGLSITKCTSSFRDNTGTIYILNIFGLGDQSNNILITDSLFFGPTLDAVLAGSGVTDIAIISNVRAITTDADGIVNATSNSFGGGTGLVVQSTGDYPSNIPFDF